MKSRTHFTVTALLLIALFGATGIHSAAAALSGPRPNVVLILADDLGWSDLGCYGADLFETPHVAGNCASTHRNSLGESRAWYLS
jgi:arylsulfatase